MGRSGQKVNPVGWRVGIYRKWKNSWIQNKLNYKDLLLTSINTSKLLRSFLRFGKKRRLFFFNYNLLNNNNLDIFCFFTRIKRKKMKFRQKKKKIKRYNRKLQQLMLNYYEKKWDVFFSKKRFKIKKVKQKHTKLQNDYNNSFYWLYFNDLKKFQKNKFKSKKPSKLFKKSKIKLKLKQKKIRYKRKSWPFREWWFSKVKRRSFKKFRLKNKKSNKVKLKLKQQNYKNKRIINKIKKRKIYYYHFFYNIEYFSLYFSFNLLNYFPKIISSKHRDHFSLTILKELFLKSFLLSNNLLKYSILHLNYKKLESFQSEFNISYERSYIEKLIINKYNFHHKHKSFFKHKITYSDNFFVVNKKHLIGKRISNKFSFSNSFISNTFKKSPLANLVYQHDLINTKYNFNQLFFNNLTFYDKFIKSTIKNIFRNKIFKSLKLASFLNLNNLYSLRLSFFYKKPNLFFTNKFLQKTFKFNQYDLTKVKKKKKTLNIYNTTKIFFKYKYLKNPLKLIKSSLNILTGYNTDVFFGSINSLYKFSRKKYWDPDNLKKLPNYRQKLYLKQIRLRKYELKKLVFKFYRRVRRRYIQLKNLKFLLRLCMLTSFVKRPIIFARYFCYQINKFPKKYRQIPFLKYVMSIFLTLSKRKEILGSRIQIQGRFDKWRRSKIIIKESGILTTRKKFFFIEYGSASSFIKKGSFGIKIWLSYSSRFSNFYKKCLSSYFNYSNFYKKNILKKKKFLNNFFQNKTLLKKEKRRKKNFSKFKQKYKKIRKKKTISKNRLKKNSNSINYYWNYKKTKWLLQQNKITELVNLGNLT